jgi:hypothetical protein
MTDLKPFECARCEKPLTGMRYGIPSWDVGCNWDWCESALGPERLCLKCVEKLQ